MTGTEVRLPDDQPSDDLPPDDLPAGVPGPTRLSGIGLTAWAALGTAAAFALAVDKIKMLQDPDFVPSCNFNPVLSCGSVITTDQASAFGFPNPFLGIGGFAVVLTLGVLLTARVELPRWIIGGVATGALLGFAFVHWLAFESLYRIGALCPWCLVVWAVTALISVWSLSWFLSGSRHGPVAAAGHWLWNWRYLVVLAWYLLVVVLVLVRFWSYWRTLG